MWSLIITFIILLYIYKYNLLSHFKSTINLISNLSSKSLPDFNNNQNSSNSKALRKSDYESYQKIKYGSGPIGFRPFILTNLETIKAVNVKDFNTFSDRHLRLDHAYSEVMNNMLSFQTGDDWKRLKAILTQAFSTRRLRRIHKTFHISVNKLVTFLRNQVKEETKLEIVGPVNKFLLDLISSSVFGFESEIFSENISIFEIYTKEIQDTMIRHREAKLIPGLLTICNFLRIQLIKPNPKAVEFFKSIIETSIKSRKSTIEKRHDILQLLMDAECVEEEGSVTNQSKLSSGWSNGQLTNDMILSQAFMFFFAGTEGPATLLVYGLYELALNPSIQERLYKELKTVMDEVEDHCLDYDTLNQLEFLEMFVCEVLRRYSSGITGRRCSSKYQVPGTDIVLQQGTNVHTPIYGIHHDEEYYHNPFEFNPENFSTETKAKRNPTAYIPFGIGPRACIAKGFGLIEGKTAISHLVYNFKVKPSTKTEIPPVGNIKSMYLPINGLWLEFEDRFH